MKNLQDRVCWTKRNIVTAIQIHDFDQAEKIERGKANTSALESKTAKTAQKTGELTSELVRRKALWNVRTVLTLTRDIRFHGRANASVLYHNHNRQRNKRNKKKSPGRERHLYSPADTYSSFFKHDSKGEKENRNNKSDYAQTKGDLPWRLLTRKPAAKQKIWNGNTHWDQLLFSPLHDISAERCRRSCRSVHD